MAAWVWVLIAVGVVAVLAVVLWQALARRRTGRLQRQFGPEYDRAVGGADDRRLAEAELQAREERRRRLDIRPLSQAARVRYTETWRVTQAQFVDDPRGAVATALPEGVNAVYELVIDGQKSSRKMFVSK